MERLDDYHEAKMRHGSKAYAEKTWATRCGTIGHRTGYNAWGYDAAHKAWRPPMKVEAFDKIAGRWRPEKRDRTIAEC